MLTCSSSITNNSPNIQVIPSNGRSASTLNSNDLLINSVNLTSIVNKAVQNLPLLEFFFNPEKVTHITNICANYYQWSIQILKLWTLLTALYYSKCLFYICVNLGCFTLQHNTIKPFLNILFQLPKHNTSNVWEMQHFLLFFVNFKNRYFNGIKYGVHCMHCSLCT